MKKDGVKRIGERRKRDGGGKKERGESEMRDVLREGENLLGGVTEVLLLVPVPAPAALLGEAGHVREGDLRNSQHQDGDHHHHGEGQLWTDWVPRFPLYPG